MQELWWNRDIIKVSFFHQCSKMQIIPIKKFNIQTCFFQFLWFFRLKCWFQGQIIPRIHLILPNAYRQMCFDRNINGNRDVKFLIGIIGQCTDERNILYHMYCTYTYRMFILRIHQKIYKKHKNCNMHMHNLWPVVFKGYLPTYSTQLISEP